VTIGQFFTCGTDLASQINWSGVAGALSSVVTAAVAILALRSWKRQERAKRETEFLDCLIEETHNYVAKMSRPIALVSIVEIGMASYIPVGEVESGEIKGAIAYIQTQGKADSQSIFDELDVVRASLTCLRSLATKGQIFKFREYESCYNAIAVLTCQFDRVEALSSIIGSPNFYWKHPEFLRSLEKVMQVKEKNVKKYLEENNVKIVQYVRDVYQEIYK
jgi:hypothetical protein